MNQIKKQPLWCALLRGVRGIGKSSVSNNYQIVNVTFTKQGSPYGGQITNIEVKALDGEQE